MKRLMLALLTAVPLAAMGAPQGPAAGRPPVDDAARLERMEKRMRVARILGLSEALDLNEAQAVKMQETMAKFDERRRPLLKQVHDSTQLLRKAASGDQAAQGQVDQATARIFEARAQLQQIDRELLGAVSKDLSPEKRARAAIFLGHFHGGPGMGPGMGHGRGPGMMRGRGGMGPGMGQGMGPGPGAGPMGPMGMAGDPPDDCPYGPESCSVQE